MAYLPIWKDTTVNLGAVASSSFTVTDGNGVTVYSGKAVRRPDEANLTVKVSDIVADIITGRLINVSGPFTDYDAFAAGITVAGNGVSQTLDFVNDWSYDRTKSYGATFILSDPIDGLVDGRQTLAVTGYWGGAENATITLSDGTTGTRAIGITGGGTYTLDLGTIADLASVTIGGKTWTVESSCREYVLHYVNAYGGWDSLLIRGGWRMTDTLTRYNHGKAYDNSQVSNRGDVNYLNNVARTWTLNTGWMTDEASGKVHHLTESTLVYLEDIQAGQLLPVTVTDTSLTYKTYKSEGRRLVSHQITVALSSTIKRK